MSDEVKNNRHTSCNNQIPSHWTSKSIVVKILKEGSGISLAFINRDEYNLQIYDQALLCILKCTMQLAISIELSNRLMSLITANFHIHIVAANNMDLGPQGKDRCNISNYVLLYRQPNQARKGWPKHLHESRSLRTKLHKISVKKFSYYILEFGDLYEHPTNF